MHQESEYGNLGDQCLFNGVEVRQTGRGAVVVFVGQSVARDLVISDQRPLAVVADSDGRVSAFVDCDKVRIDTVADAGRRVGVPREHRACLFGTTITVNTTSFVSEQDFRWC